jgi:hypothetical protein
MNSLAAQTPSEYLARLSATRVSGFTSQIVRGDPPDSLDWRNASFVPPVVNADLCASWPFAALVPMSHLYYQAQKQQQLFSAQNLIDCVTSNDGCGGGNVKNAWNYVIAAQDGRVPTNEVYPFVFPESEDCRFDSAKSLAVLRNAVAVGLGNETDLLISVATYGPVVVGIDAATPAFQLYQSGVFEDSHCSTIFVNHEMNVVGYGSYGDTPYWIVQNTWGASWGEAGYIRMIRGKNLCGIATYAVHAE